MNELLRKSMEGNLEAKYELFLNAKEHIDELLSGIKRFSNDELQRLGTAFKQFPFGCDLVEVLVDVVSLRQDMLSIEGSFRLVDRLGMPTHMCAYVVADLAEREGATPLELAKRFRRITNMPIDVDHFGSSGPMRYPKEISMCPGDCYNSGKPFNGCPRGRQFKRLLDKERKYANEKEGWVRDVAQSISINLFSAQKPTTHAASKDEMLSVARFAKSYGKGTSSIICVGDGESELLNGVKACVDAGIDEIVVEGGPYNKVKDRPRGFAEAVVLSRLVSPGKVVATNGQYEDELRMGLRCGLNGVISGFPGNHHAYMSGFNPGQVNISNFGLPRVTEIIAEEVKDSYFPVPSNRLAMEVIAKSAKFLTNEFIYPNFSLAGVPVGDAHWIVIGQAPIAEKQRIKFDINGLTELLKGREVKRLGLIATRFVSWVVAFKARDFVDEILLSDRDKKVEEATYFILKRAIGEDVKLRRMYGNDERCIEESDTSVVCSFVPDVVKRFECSDKVITLS